MNYLEEVEFSRQLNPNELQRVEANLSPLLGPLEALRAETSNLTRDTQKNVSGDQVRIIEDLRAYNLALIKPNEQILHRVMQKERELRQHLEQFHTNIHPSMQTPPPEVSVSVRDIDTRIESLRGQLIDSLETVDFTRIAQIKKVDEVVAPSFHKLWVWVLEVYFGTSASRYDWEDFSGKVMTKRHENARELKRRMITFEPAELAPYQRQELDDLVTGHRKLISDKVANPELHKFLEALKIVLEQATLANDKLKMEVSNSESLDVVKSKEEEEKTLAAEQKLNATRFDLTSEIHNLYLLIEDEFN